MSREDIRALREEISALRHEIRLLRGVAACGFGSGTDKTVHGSGCIVQRHKEKENGYFGLDHEPRTVNHERGLKWYADRR